MVAFQSTLPTHPFGKAGGEGALDEWSRPSERDAPRRYPPIRHKPITPRLLGVKCLEHFCGSGKKNLKMHLTFLVVERKLKNIFDGTSFCRCVIKMHLYKVVGYTSKK